MGPSLKIVSLELVKPDSREHPKTKAITGFTNQTLDGLTAGNQRKHDDLFQFISI